VSEGGDCAWASEADRQKDLRHRKIADIKYSIYMWWHGFYWKVLHLCWLARPYSIAMCRLRLYRKFPDGRCMWCGEKHNL
jgi:hypothetical protein